MCSSSAAQRQRRRGFKTLNRKPLSGNPQPLQLTGTVGMLDADDPPSKYTATKKYWDQPFGMGMRHCVNVAPAVQVKPQNPKTLEAHLTPPPLPISLSSSHHLPPPSHPVAGAPPLRLHRPGRLRSRGDGCIATSRGSAAPLQLYTAEPRVEVAVAAVDVCGASGGGCYEGASDWLLLRLGLAKMTARVHQSALV